MNLLKLLVISLTVFLISGCAAKKPVVIKEFYAENLEDFLNKMKLYNSIDGILNIQYEAKNTVLNGDASLKISKNELLLRVYYMGFPTGEIHEENGEVTSNLLIEKDRLKQITTGIRKGFIWWDGDFLIAENSDEFILKEKNSERVVILNKSDFLPVRQTLNIEGQNVLITYNNYNKIHTEDGTVLNIPLNIMVHYKNRTLRIKIEQIKIKSA